jgi:hypothetical protein
VPSRKQRRRRLKERRHDYEYVYVDEEGREVEAPEDEQPQARARSGKATASGRRAGATTRTGRRVEPPSWNRVGKRALFFGPVMFLALHLIGKNLSLAQQIYETVFLLLFFLPVSYFMDSMMYRQYLKRTGAAPPPGRGRRGSNGAA